MSDLDDWSDKQTGLAAELLRAGRRETSSASARARATEAMSLVGVTGGGPSVAGSFWLTCAKWLAISLALLGAGELGRRFADRAAGAAPALSAALRPITPRATFMASAPASASPRESSPWGVSAGDAKPAPPTRVRAVEASPSASPRDARLRQELDVLHAARDALAQGQPRQAVALLEGKKGGFQLLQVEAALVRIEALANGGDRAGARRLAERLLSQHASGPYGQTLARWAAELP